MPTVHWGGARGSTDAASTAWSHGVFWKKTLPSSVRVGIHLAPRCLNDWTSGSLWLAAVETRDRASDGTSGSKLAWFQAARPNRCSESKDDQHTKKPSQEWLADGLTIVVYIPNVGHQGSQELHTLERKKPEVFQGNSADLGHFTFFRYIGFTQERKKKHTHDTQGSLFPSDGLQPNSPCASNLAPLRLETASQTSY